MNNEDIVEEEIIKKNNYETEKQVEKDIKSNEDVMKEKIHNILTDLEEVDKREKYKERRKKLFWTISFIIEIIIIILIIKSR